MVTDTQILNTVACYLLMHVAYRLKTKPVIIVRKAVISRFAVLNLSPFRSPKFLLQLFSFIKLLFSVVLRNKQKNWNTQQLLYSFSSLAERFSLTFCFVLVFNYETHARNISPLGILFAYFSTTVWIPLDQCDLNTIKKTALQITLVSEALLMLLPALLIHNMPNSSIVFGVSHVVILYLHIPGILETILKKRLNG